MVSGDVAPFVVMALVAVAFGIVCYVFLAPLLSGEQAAEKRLQSALDSRGRGRRGNGKVDEQMSSRKKAVADTLKELEARQKQTEKVSLRLRLERAGLELEPQSFWIASGITGAVHGVICFVAIPNIHPVVCLAVAFVGAFGVPRWFVNRMTTRRQKKFLNEFANAIDVIVRGVKSGLPLNECLNVIARESPEPVRSEFREVVEQQRVGIPLQECFDRMISRLPMPEVKFFSIVIAIQQTAGGNLSEALGNLAGVLRDRKQMAAKVQALSAEAKASAAVLAALPFAVMIMVYLTTPKYIMLLFTTKTGNFMLVISAVWMTMGVLVMRKMINSKF